MKGTTFFLGLSLNEIAHHTEKYLKRRGPKWCKPVLISQNPIKYELYVLFLDQNVKFGEITLEEWGLNGSMIYTEDLQNIWGFSPDEFERLEQHSVKVLNGYAKNVLQMNIDLEQDRKLDQLFDKLGITFPLPDLQAENKVYTPEQLKTLTEWKAAWRKIKGAWKAGGRSYAEFAEIAKVSESTIKKIIKAGEAGKLD